MARLKHLHDNVTVSVPTDYVDGFTIDVNTDVPFGSLINIQAGDLETNLRGLMLMLEGWNLEEPFSEESLKALPYKLILDIVDALVAHIGGKNNTPLGSNI